MSVFARSTDYWSGHLSGLKVCVLGVRSPRLPRSFPFHVHDYFLAFVNVLTSYTFFLLVFTNVLMSQHFISWWLQRFYVKPFSFLMGTNVSRHLPLFIDSFGRFTLKPFIFWRITYVSHQNSCFLDGYERFFIKKPLIQRTAFFRQILLFLLSFLHYS